METAKQSQHYRYGNYDLDLVVFGERKLSMSVIDNVSRVEYHEKDILLETIGVNTLMKALEKTKQEIKLSFVAKNMAENNLL